MNLNLAPTAVQLKPTAEKAIASGLNMLCDARALGTPTSRWLAPSFVIVGAQRCGTTSMYRYLTAHSQVVRALNKEVHFFDVHYSSGLDWYAAHFVSRRQAQVLARRRGGRVITGEASPYYLYHPGAIQRLHRQLPDAKIVVMLRDPVQRAISHHSHEWGKGWETADFEQALRLEESRLAGEEAKLEADPAYSSFAHQHYSYLARGDYLPQLQRLHKFYAREQVHLINSDEFYKHPAEVYGRLLRFLDLPQASLPTYKQYNTYKTPKPDSATRARLVRHFSPRNAALYDYLGDDLGWSR